jgi:hypothetical protein
MLFAELDQLLPCDHERAQADLPVANAEEQDRHHEPAEYEPELADRLAVNLSL